MELRKAVVDLRDVAKDAELAVRSLITARQLSLSTSIREEPIYVYGDETRLQQILVNIHVNAAKYTPAGGDIDFSIVRDSSEVIAVVKDNGIGERLARLDSTSI